ncbi:MAG: TetR family transcriptional regulator [Candidatus Aegiribacteria sp.]|nr:TetR family transcriptional regulator [Candidatus Aegiribacteria sp.]MBD3295454.1 TetR family transcriptional regulator [Candidatus Fermentibacteria bacterium]
MRCTMKMKSGRKRELILKAARQEFLEKGFRGGSLRNIAERVSATTGVIYTYFRNKDDIFRNLVEPAVNEIQHFLEMEETSFLDVKESGAGIREWFSRYLKFLIDLIERYPDAMRLLFVKSSGSGFENYRDQLIEIGKNRGRNSFRELERTEEFRGEEISDFFIHNLVNYVFDISVEIIKNDLPRKDLQQFEAEIRAFLFKGWNGLVKI